jgi:hypothetical protein
VPRAYLPRTIPPFQETKETKRAESIPYGMNSLSRTGITQKIDEIERGISSFIVSPGFYSSDARLTNGGV